MITGTLIVGAPSWVVPAVLFGVVACWAVFNSYWGSPLRNSVRVTAVVLKLVGISAILICLVEPLLSEKRPKAGANTVIVLADNSQSMNMFDSGSAESRGENLRALLQPENAWLKRLTQDFDVRWYAFDTRLRGIRDATELTFQGPGSAIKHAIDALSKRYRDRGVSGIMVLSDGIATDRVEELFDNAQLPPIFPVLTAQQDGAKDIRVSNVSVTQTNFEAAPVTIRGQIECDGYDDLTLTAELRDEAGSVLESMQLAKPRDEPSVPLRFQFRPAAAGVLFYELRVFEEGKEASFDVAGNSDEVTLINNRRLVTVQRGIGPYRVLYVAGRPNWEFKFLRRSLQQDSEVELVGLLRIASREAKFDFRGHQDETTNPLYRGFGNQADEQAEQYDEPVLMRLGTRDEVELRDGFPKAAGDLFAYDAVILDDIEASFFTRDQLSLIQKFVSQRGGGFMMFGGQESFEPRDYQHTPIADVLPVYLDRMDDAQRDDRYRQLMTKEGLLQPWVRLRSTEDAERQRMNALPAFHVVNRIDAIKPGATVLSYVRASSGEEYPALVTQRFGKGRALALAIGDIWRWGMRRGDDEPVEMEKAWRQMVRWLVADVPGRVDVEVVAATDKSESEVQLVVSLRDPSFVPLDNASVTIKVVDPDGNVTNLTAEPSSQTAGEYRSSYLPAKTGGHRVEVTATAVDGSAVGTASTGWSADPARAEYEKLKVDRELMTRLADVSQGEVIDADRLKRFVASLPNREHVVKAIGRFSRPLSHAPRSGNSRGEGLGEG
jgi:uncharacterized membrane protein